MQKKYTGKGKIHMKSEVNVHNVISKVLKWMRRVECLSNQISRMPIPLDVSLVNPAGWNS